MAAYLPAYYSDVINNIAVAFSCSPPAFVIQDTGPLRHEFKPTTLTNVVINGPYGPELVRAGIGSRLLQQGGGIQTITVGFWARRFERGDGEKWLWDLLVRLGRTDLGELVVDGVAYRDCWFTAGEGTVEPTWHTEPDGKTGAQSVRKQSAKVAGTLTFVRSIPGVSGDLNAPATSAPQDAPLYGFGSDSGNYTAFSGTGGTVKLGRYCDLVGVSVDRPVTYSMIPRCYGVRIKGRGHVGNPALDTTLDYRRGRNVRLRLRGYVRANETDLGVPDPIPISTAGRFNEARARLQNRISNLQWKLRDHVWTLAGNGNMFFDCHLTSLEPDQDDQAYNTWPFNLELDQEYNEVSFG